MIGKESPFGHLRPTSTPEMLDRAYTVAVRFAPLLAGASFLFAAEHLLSIGLNARVENATTAPYGVAAMLALVLFGEFAAALALLALFQGLIFPLRPVSPRALARTALRKLPGYLLTHLLYIFALVFAGTISWGFFTSQEIGSPAIRSAAGIVTALAGLYMAIRLSLAPIACLIEDSSPLRAFGRSWHLTALRPRTYDFPADRPPLRWFAVAALPALIVLCIIGAFATASVVGLNTSILSSNPETALLKDFLWFATTWIATPFYWAGLMALYIEYRMRHEALDFYLRLRELRRKEGDPEALA